MRNTHHRLRVWFGNSLRSWRLPSGATIGDVALLLGDFSSRDGRLPVGIAVTVNGGLVPPSVLH
jgi:hypothetical protein